MNIASDNVNISMFILLLLFAVCGESRAQAKKYYFYFPEKQYGSELHSTPWSLFVNGGFDVLRNGGHENNGETINIFKLDYKQGFTNVWDNITSPAYHINKYGWKRFLKNEVFPSSLNVNEAQWVPNYGHHILGSGMLYVRMAGWFDYHDYRYPYFLSMLTTTAYQALNEALENNHSNKTNVDPIADLLIFNPLGFLVFSFDGVKRFFSETIQMYDWSLQPVFNPYNYYLENAGLQFVFKYQPSFSRRYGLFFYYGIYGIGGLSYRFDDGAHLSVGAGTVVNRLNENIINNSRIITPITDGALGIFYDWNHSLMTSVLITGPRLYNARINIYPGFFRLGWFRPGFYLAFGEWDRFVTGFSLVHFPVGLLGGSD